MIACLVGGGLYAVPYITANNSRRAAATFTASAILGALCVGLDNVTESPLGTGIAGLYLMVGILTRGAPAIELAGATVQAISTKA